MNMFRVWFNDSWFVFQNSSWSFREPYFSTEHLFHESYKVNRTQESLREKCLSVFWVILVRIFPYSNWIRRNTPYLSVSPYSVRIGGNATQNNSEYKRFLRSDKFLKTSKQVLNYSAMPLLYIYGKEVIFYEFSDFR